MKLFYIHFVHKASQHHASAWVMADCELMARAELYEEMGSMDYVEIVSCEAAERKVIINWG